MQVSTIQVYHCVTLLLWVESVLHATDRETLKQRGMVSLHSNTNKVPRKVGYCIVENIRNSEDNPAAVKIMNREALIRWLDDLGHLAYGAGDPFLRG